MISEPQNSNVEFNTRGLIEMISDNRNNKNLINTQHHANKINGDYLSDERAEVIKNNDKRNHLMMPN